MTKSIDTQNKGINCNEENKLVDLDFADVIALIAESTEDLQDLLTSNLEKAAAKVRIKISQDKIKVTAIKYQDIIINNNQIKVGEKPVESMGKFKYLGRLINANGNVDDDINMKIGKTAANFKKINKIYQFPLD